jgi:DNA gyrase subunit B/topoisomerase-4 subunit B
MDARYRILLEVEIDSLLETDRTFVDLLGKDAGQRHRFVMDRAGEVALDEVDV